LALNSGFGPGDGIQKEDARVNGVLEMVAAHYPDPDATSGRREYRHSFVIIPAQKSSVPGYVSTAWGITLEELIVAETTPGSY
jgi:hypothetical protein